MRRAGRWIAGLSAAGLAALLSACAGAPRDVSLPIDDPNEQFNRGVLHLNQVVLDPPATVIKQVPGPVRDRLQDLDANLKEPRVLGNDLLQGRFNAAAITVGRIIFNTTFGLGGLFDVASQGGLPQQTGDFGQTMFVWGVPSGAYTVSPYFGPSTQRDSIGGIVDTVGDPVGWVVGGLWIGWPWSIGSGAVSAVAHLAQWKQAENSSVDFYSFLRSSYYQTRRNQLREALGLPPVVESPATPTPVAGGAGHAGPGGGVAGLQHPAAAVEGHGEVELALSARRAIQRRPSIHCQAARPGRPSASSRTLFVRETASARSGGTPSSAPNRTRPPS